MKQKWKPYAALLLAGMISLSGICSVRTPASVHTAAAGVQSGGMGQGVLTDGTGQDGNAQTDPDQNTAGNDGAPDSGGKSPQVNASVSENPEVNADVTEDDPKTDADVTKEDPEVNADVTEDDPKTDTDSDRKKPEISADITIDDEEDDHVVITEKDKPYLALGANLNNEQKQTVLNLMGIDPASLDQYQIVTVTNEEEHQYLDDYLDASIIGTRALSSVVIAKRDKGDGIHISTKNISYCTIGMYKNALATAGLEDADVIIAGPFPLSGTAALIGAMKAYADMEEESLDTESLDAAMNEIVVTGELNESLGDDVQTEEFIAYVKQKVVEGGLESKEKIQEVIAQACDKFEISLSEGEKERITALMEKIGSLDINVDSLLEQAGSIYDSLKEMEKSSGFFSRIAAFLKELLDAVIRFFKNLF